MNKILWILAILSLCFNAYGADSYSKTIRKLTHSFLKDYAQPQQLRLEGYGGGMSGDLRTVFVSLVSKKKLNVSQARELFVKLAEEYLQTINKNKEVRPYLHNFPFNIDNSQLEISFEDEKGCFNSNGLVAFIFVGKNQTLFFEGYASEAGGFYSLHQEPYEEAVRIVKDHAKPYASK